MTQNSRSPRSALSRPVWPDRAMLWRWHFFAGLFCLPFVIMLCVTGSLYLFKPQIETWLDRDIDRAVAEGTPRSVSAQRDAALAAVPGGHFLALEMPTRARQATRVLVEHGADVARVYIDPVSLRVLAQRDEQTRFERLVFRLHGQLLIGNWGSVIMEMVASWTLVLIVTGLLLWWPRRTGIGGTVLPRLGAKGRVFWRDLHAVGGVWISLVLVLFLVSGLPWSFVWGSAFSAVESRIGRLVSVQDWEIGAVPIAATISGHATMPGMSDSEMAGMSMDSRSEATTAQPAIPPEGLDAVYETARRLAFPAPALITPPATAGAPWRLRSDAQNRPKRIEASVTAQGQVTHITRFADKGLSDRLIGYGVAFHEGHLFGVLNLLLNLIVALLLTLASIAALILWLRRRRPGHLDAPRASPRRIGWGALAVMGLMGVLLPELGVSLLLLALANRFLSGRFSALR
ncbi:PepSY-associated TM helix domain-containing protein [Asaia krungthepensis]|uniref:Iron-regulated membrane protein n=1 Tax=Asaia krungthepensis NRIC 0535 TaxID=1307925 RepID=A0ABQ0Q483_9PROT|nr:PepSY domain-containing protein [Asaia krungthepensis]GBQ90470.1 putative iron-regulated membrane protein [Asaia krungthepensis NRIC 0535]